MIAVRKYSVDNKPPTILDFIERSKLYAPEFNNRYSGKEKLLALDIGASFSIPLIALYHNFGFIKFIGVDKNTEAVCVTEHLERLRKFGPQYYPSQKHASTFYELYQASWTETVGEKPLIKSKEEFDRIFTNTFCFETQDVEYLSKVHEKFDFIMSSNLLHLKTSRQEVACILTKMQQVLRENGIIFIRVESRPNFDYAHYKQNLETLFPEGEIHEVWNEDLPVYSQFINIQTPL